MKKVNRFLSLLLVLGLAACGGNAPVSGEVPAPPEFSVPSDSVPSESPASSELFPNTPLTSQGQSGHFVASCEITHRLKDDPIVYPGEPGAAHSHDFFGTNKANAFSTLTSLRSGTSSCLDRPGDTAAYWSPTLYYGSKAVTPRRIRVYYRNGGKNPATIRPFPAGLKMIAGDATASVNRKQSTSVAAWACTVSGDEKEVQNVPRCKGDSLRLRIVFPDCWDGKNLDSADHKSHMAYSRSGRCQSGWVPVPQITIGLRYWYNDGLGRDPSKVTLSSGNAYNAHADFFNSWDQSNLEALVKYCINAARNCGDTGGPKPTLTAASAIQPISIPNNLLNDTSLVNVDEHSHHASH